MDTDYGVGIPARNEAANISGLLESLLGQTVSPAAVIVCVNGSTDNTYEIAAGYAAQDPLVQVIRSAPGKVNAWHAIADRAPADKIMFCDGDVLPDREAAARLLDCLAGNPNLIIAGGTIWSINAKKTFFARYCVAAETGPPVPQWLTGGLYMVRLGALRARAAELGLELLPRDLINEDGFLELITAGRNKFTQEAFVKAAGVDSFRDWRRRYVRILAGKLQLEQRYASLIRTETAAADGGEPNKKTGRIKRVWADLRAVFAATRTIDSFRVRLGVRGVALAKLGLNLYYKLVGGPYCKTTWTPAASTKKQLAEHEK
ncbi:MAG: glycosyltransferase family A protein [Victivallaceae bacterium]|nr:glycosyltransferase family A protein [Victivallaceae bacterium]